MSAHQYVCRASDRVVDEELFGDWTIRFLYAEARERAPILFRALTSPWVSRLLGALHYDWPFSPRLLGNQDFLARCGVDLAECLDPPEHFVTPRDLFERRIRYWSCRPMPEDPNLVVSPADARVLVGSLRGSSPIFAKGKFFEIDALLGSEKRCWHRAFHEGDFAVFRLTPDRYHYNHVPVSGRVVDFYEVDGLHPACNPTAVVELVTPYSKNRRVVTVLDPDVPGGSQVGLVAMLEVVALMVGEVVQCYSRERYDDPCPVAPGLFLERGRPKSCYRPGSSTDVLLFQAGRVRFAEDLIENLSKEGARSRYSAGFGRPLVETDVQVRTAIARRATSEETG